MEQGTQELLAHTSCVPAPYQSETQVGSYLNNIQQGILSMQYLRRLTAPQLSWGRVCWAALWGCWWDLRVRTHHSTPPAEKPRCSFFLLSLNHSKSSQLTSHVDYHSKRDIQGLVLKAISESREASWITIFCTKLIQKLVQWERKPPTFWYWRQQLLFKTGDNLSNSQRPCATALVSSEKRETKIVSVHISSHHNSLKQ